MARLKVYRAHLGFYDAVVAAPSQKAALEAWGTRRNLFREGMAGLAEDEQGAGSARARPGTVLTRAAGSGEPYRSMRQTPKVPAPSRKRDAARNKRSAASCRRPT